MRNRVFHFIALLSKLGVAEGFFKQYREGQVYPTLHTRYLLDDIVQYEFRVTVKSG